MINCSTYFFEGIKREYYQYPLDSHREQFKSYQAHFNSDSQIVVHRKPNLMYYTYMRRLANNGGNAFFGIAVIINGLETSNIKSFFKLFERIFQKIVNEGTILTITKNGDIVPKDDPFVSYATHFDRLSGTISKYINEGQSFFLPMKPVNFAATNNDFDCVFLAEGEAKIRERLSQFNVLYIIKHNETLSPEINGLAIRIEHLGDQLEYLKERNRELEERRSEQPSSVSWKILAISLFVILCVICLVVLYCAGSGLISFNLP